MSIEVTTPPNKISYLAGETFNSAGMVVTASYGMSGVVITTAEVTGYAVAPDPLIDGINQVTITYSELGETCQTTQAVTVTHKLTSIAVTTNPTTTEYEYQDTLQTAGMVVQATYSDGQTSNVTGYSCSPTALNTVGAQAITVSYSENGVTQTTAFNVTVNRKSVAKPTWKSNLTYTGSSQSVNNTSYWNNFNTAYMSIGGTTSATNAGTQTASFTLGANYRWADGTTNVLNVNWTINRATGSLSVSPTTVEINGSNYNTGVAITITRSGDGAISYSPTSVAGLTITLSGTTLTIKGDGSTAIDSQVITVRVAQGTNYTAPSNKTITVKASYWEWGSETATADAAWFLGLHNYLAANTASTINSQGWVGKTKSVTLSSAVLGTTTHLIRCIGVNQDADKTVTFQTANTLATATVFGSAATWSNSTAKTQCQNYYNAFPGKAYILTVSKGTNTAYNSSSVAYTNETVFLPSIHEMGLSSYSYAPTAGEYTNGKNASYSYYTSNTTRIKNQGDSGSAYYYWTRSRSTNDSSNVCRVYSDGSGGGSYYSSSRGLAPAFVIG